VIIARQVTLGPPVRPILPLEALRARLAQLLDGDPWLEAEDEDARLWRCILPGSTSGMLATRAKSERTVVPRVNNWSPHVYMGAFLTIDDRDDAG